MFCTIATEALKHTVANYDKSFEYYYYQLINDVCETLVDGEVGYVYSMAQAEDIARKMHARGYEVRVCGYEDGALRLVGTSYDN
jgi:hypothetical protein